MAWWRKRESTDRVHVAYVKDRDRFAPFYWAICSCDWAGERRPDGPGAADAAFADAQAHAEVHAELQPIEVVPEVAYPLDGP